MSWYKGTETPSKPGDYLVRLGWRNVPIVAYWSPSRGWSERGIKLPEISEWHQIPD